MDKIFAFLYLVSGGKTANLQQSFFMTIANVHRSIIFVEFYIFTGLLNGASQKAESVATFHVGEICTSLQKVTLIPGGWESLIYTTISGSVGVLVPFTSHEDHDFFQHLEMHMRNENSPLCGRDHLSFRSYYYPVKVSRIM